MLPRNWSAPCELIEMRYKFRVKCREGFQLVDASDFGISLTAITLTGKNVSIANFMLE